MDKLTHFDDGGNVTMVDISGKEEGKRIAKAESIISMQPETLSMILEGTVSKGDVLGTARLAGIMGAKKAADLIPLCHPLALTSVEIELICDQRNNTITILATVGTKGRTGVEMEALTAASIAALTLYDMTKSVDRSMVIQSTRLKYKSGGKSGVFRAD